MDLVERKQLLEEMRNDEALKERFPDKEKYEHVQEVFDDCIRALDGRQLEKSLLEFMESSNGKGE